MRLVKWVGITIAGLLALAVLGIALFAVFFNPNDYKADIARLAEQRTQRKLTLQGDLKLTVFPWLAVKLGPAQLGERPGFGEQPFVSFEEAQLSIRLMPLFHGELEIGDVRLIKPSIRLITDERGRHNWSDLSENNANAPAQAINADSKVNASVAGLRIQDGVVVIDDRKAKTRTAIRDFNLTTGNISSTKPFDLAVAFVVEQDRQRAMPVKLSATVTPDFDAQRHVLKNVSFATQVTTNKNASSVPLTLDVHSLAVDLRQQTFAMDGLKLSFGNANMTGTLSGKEIFDAPQISGQIDLASFSPRELMSKLGLDAPVTRDASVLKQFSLQAQVQATKNSVTMKNVQMKLDGTTAGGELAIVDIDANALRFDLNLDRMDFDRYLPPPEKPAAAKSVQDNAPTPTPIPVEALRALNARGDLRIGDATFAGMRLAKLHVSVNARDGDVRFAPTDAALYGGQYRGSMTIDVTGKVPRLVVESHADHIDFAPLFKDMFDTNKVSGRGQANIKANATGADTLAMQKTLAGNLDFNVTNGAFEGTDLWYEIKRARALLHREALPERIGAARTPFTTCKGTGAIQNGVLTNNDLDIAMQYLKVGGSGSVDIVKSTLDYKLNVQVLRMADDANAGDLVDAQIPVKVSGSLASPSIRPDVEGLVKARVKQEVEKQKDKAREKLQEKLQNKLQDLFRR